VGCLSFSFKFFIIIQTAFFAFTSQIAAFAPCKSLLMRPANRPHLPSLSHTLALLESCSKIPHSDPMALKYTLLSSSGARDCKRCAVTFLCFLSSVHQLIRHPQIRVVENRCFRQLSPGHFGRCRRAHSRASPTLDSRVQVIFQSQLQLRCT
jgi:hypothetical protein